MFFERRGDPAGMGLPGGEMSGPMARPGRGIELSKRFEHQSELDLPKDESFFLGQSKRRNAVSRQGLECLVNELDFFFFDARNFEVF